MARIDARARPCARRRGRTRRRSSRSGTTASCDSVSHFAATAACLPSSGKRGVARVVERGAVERSQLAVHAMMFDVARHAVVGDVAVDPDLPGDALGDRLVAGQTPCRPTRRARARGTARSWTRPRVSRGPWSAAPARSACQAARPPCRRAASVTARQSHRHRKAGEGRPHQVTTGTGT